MAHISRDGSITGQAPRAPLLIVRGGDDPDRALRVGHQIKWTGTTDMFRLVRDEVAYHRLHVTRNMLRQGRAPELSGYETVLNLITEPERNERSLGNLEKLLRGFRGRVVNRPEAILKSTRDQVARLLEGAPGWRVPKVLRVPAGRGVDAARLARAGIDGPIILRQAGTHTGKSVELLESIASAPPLERRHDHLITEFVDFRSPDGFYRKYRVYFFGQAQVFRHLYVCDDWNIHSGVQLDFMADRPELLDEARVLYRRPEGDFPAPVHAALRELRARMPLDFFGVDFGMLPSGELVLFEANPAMRYLRFPDDPRFHFLKVCIAPARDAFRAMLGLPDPSVSLAGMRAPVA